MMDFLLTISHTEKNKIHICFSFIIYRNLTLNQEFQQEFVA